MECQPRVLLPLLMCPFLQFRLPGNRHLFMVLRVREAKLNSFMGKILIPFFRQAAESETQAAIIDLDGKFYTDPPYIQARGW